MKTSLALIAVLSALALAACGDDESDPTTTSAAPPATTSTDETTDPGSGGVGPNELLRQGVAPEGVNIATSPGGATADLNDNASAELTSSLQGSSVELRCTFEDGSESIAGTGEWPADAGNLTFVPDFDKLATTATSECTVATGGNDVATATMEPVGP